MHPWFSYVTKFCTVQSTRNPPGKISQKNLISHQYNLAADCWILVKFGTWMHYESPEAAEL